MSTLEVSRKETVAIEPGDCPEGWNVARLGDGLVVDLQPGFACGANNREGRGIGHLRPMNVSEEGRVDLAVLKFVPQAEAEREERLIRSGDVIFNNTNSSELVGKTAFYRLDEPLAFSNHMTRIRCRSEILDPQYSAMALHYLWRQGYFQTVCNNHVSQASVSRSVLFDTQIPVPPTAEQKRIVAKVEALLARVNAARERLTRLPAILKRFRQAILAAACSGRLTANWRAAATEFERASILVSRLRHRHPEWSQDEFFDEDLFEIPDSWQWVGLGSLGETVTGNTPPKKDQRNFGGDVPFFKPTELDAGYNVVRSVDSLTQKGARLARLVPPQTVMVTCIGATIGKTGFSRVEAATNQQINSVVTDPDTVSPEWLFFVVSSPWVQAQIRLRASETTLPLLNKGRFQKLPIPFPPAGEQHEIVRRVEALFALADVIEKRVAAATARAEKLTQAILAKAFRGELVPTEAELAHREGRDYEPASALLARIRAERAANASSSTRRRKPNPRPSTHSTNRQVRF